MERREGKGRYHKLFYLFYYFIFIFATFYISDIMLDHNPPLELGREDASVSSELTSDHASELGDRSEELEWMTDDDSNELISSSDSGSPSDEIGEWEERDEDEERD